MLVNSLEMSGCRTWFFPVSCLMRLDDGTTTRESSEVRNAEIPVFLTVMTTFVCWSFGLIIVFSVLTSLVIGMC